jgi:hypothetical protein
MFYALLLMVSQAFAQDTWSCVTDSSHMRSNQFYACGVGQSKWEGIAREHAFARAQNEFIELCNLSTECIKKKRLIDPGRTSCDRVPNGDWKCYRLILITLED